MSENVFTVGDLKKALNGIPDNTKLTFAGLTFYRVKRWADDEVFIEFSEAMGYLTPEFTKRNPHVQVAFISSNAVQWEGNGVGTVDAAVR
jgi:hypothetical protein